MTRIEMIRARKSILVFVLLGLAMGSVGAASSLQEEVAHIAKELAPRLQASDRIAVMDFKGADGSDNPLGSYVATLLATELANRKFHVVERKNIDELMREQKLERSGAIAQQDVLQLGKMAGANRLVLGSVAKLEDTFSVSLRVINVESGVNQGGVNGTLHVSEGLAQLAAPVASSAETGEPVPGATSGFNSELKQIAATDPYEIDLHGTVLDDDGLRRLGALQRIEKLNISRTRITDQALETVRKWTTLRELNISENAVTDRGIGRLVSLKNLRWLEASHTRLTNAGMASLAQLESLQHLELNGVWINASGLSQLVKAPNLESLFLSDSGLRDEDLSAFLRFPSLWQLYLERTPLTDRGAHFLAQLASLTSLNLNETHLTDVGLAELVRLAGLSSLGLAHTRVTDQGVQLLMKCPNLDVVFMRDSAVTPGGVAELKKKYLMRYGRVLRTDFDPPSASSTAPRRDLYSGGIVSPPETLDSVLKQLRDPALLVRRQAIINVHAYDMVEAGDEIRGLVLHDPDLYNREWAMWTLSWIRPAPDQDIAVLREAMKNPSFDIRLRAAISLSLYDVKDPDVIAMLTQGLSFGDLKVRDEAAHALEALRPGAPH